MHDILQNARQVVVALWQLGRRRHWLPRTWHFYALWVSRLTRFALVAVIAQPLAVILASLTGVHELTVFVALTPVLALLFLLVVASLPRHQDELATALAIGTGLAAWDRTAKILSAILRGLSLFLLLDLAFGLYFSLLPVENDRRLVLWIVFLGIIFLLAVALQPASRRKAIVNSMVGILLVGSAVAVFVLFPVLLLEGGWGATKKDVSKAFKNDAKAVPAEVVTTGFQRDEDGNLVAVINLPTDGSKTGPAIDTRLLPTGRLEADVPRGTLVCWEKEPCVPAGDFSRKGKVRFAHPGGGVMTFTVIPD